MMYFSLCVRVILLSIISPCTSKLWQVDESLFKSWVIFHCITYIWYLRWYIHSIISKCFSYLYILSMVNKAAINIGPQISFQHEDCVFFAYMSRRTIAGSCGSCSFNFLGHPYCFHRGRTSAHVRSVQRSLFFTRLPTFIIS